METQWTIWARQRGKVYKLRLEARSRAPVPSGQWWTPPVTPEFRRYADDMVADFELEFRDGVRIF